MSQLGVLEHDWLYKIVINLRAAPKRDDVLPELRAESTLNNVVIPFN